MDAVVFECSRSALSNAACAFSTACCPRSRSFCFAASSLARSRSRRFCDDAQSIYSFRAATVRNILDFPHQFLPPAHIITLDRNYRSTQTVLAAANGVIGLAKERFTKNLWTERTSGAKPQLVSVRDETDQARFIVERVLEMRESGTLLKEQAVLFRTSSHSGPLEIELTRRSIPFVKFGGLKFLEAAHIKDMLALLRFVENPRDRVAGFRLLHLLPGIGPATAQRVLDRMAEATDPIAALSSRPIGLLERRENDAYEGCQPVQPLGSLEPVIRIRSATETSLRTSVPSRRT
jgi:superfamily I DNA/RNA helicase